MDRLLELAYLALEVSAPDDLDAFFEGIVGLAPGEPDDGASTWRNDDRSHRILVQSGPADDATHVGLEAVDSDAFDAISARLLSAGFELESGTADDRRHRRVDRLARTTAPWGVAIEIVERLASARVPFESPLVPGGFVTEGIGFGHVVFATTEFDESHRFLVDGLGFEQSDWLEMEIMEGVELVVRFYHCNERHHTIALARAPFELPRKLHHVMFETRDRDDVGAAFDRAWETELPIPNGLGRHDNDGMFSFYVQSPAGFQVEIGHGARVVTDDWDDNRRYERISAWGHQPLRS